MELFSAPLICPSLIGRAAEREALYTLIFRTGSTFGQIALISGEAGVGKSRLVAEAKAYASAQGFLVLQGNCFQMDSSYPYAPLLDLLRSSTTLTSNLTSATASAAGSGSGQGPAMLEFARLLPELTESLQAHPHAPHAPHAPLSDPEQEKRRLFAALTRFFKELSDRQPLLLVFEDLHWCDSTSLEYLQSLTRIFPNQPILLLLTYRNSEVQPSLQRFFAYLERARLSHELPLVPLSRRDVDAMLHAMFALQEDERAGVVDIIYPLAEGNPLFVEELLTSLVSRGELSYGDGAWHFRPQQDRQDHVGKHLPVPRTVQGAVQERMRSLSPQAIKVVTLAAVAGKRFDFTMLQKVMHCDEDQLLMWIKELVGAQLVVEVSAEQFAFRHALTQQAVYMGLLARERRLLHRALAEAIEQLHDEHTTNGANGAYATSASIEVQPEDLAYHYYEAEVWDKALEYEQLAGEKAATLYAPNAAIQHFTRALSALSHLPEDQQTRLAAICHERGQAYETLGDFERALSDYESALEASVAAQDSRKEWQSLDAIGFLWTGRDYERAGIWFRQALALAEKLADPKLHARSLNRLGNWLVNIGQIQEGLEAHQEALRLFEAEQNVRGRAETLELLGMTCYFTGDPARTVRDFFGPLIELFRTLGDSQSLFPNLAARAMDSAPETIESTYSALRTREECMKDLEEAARLAQQTGSQSGQAFVEMATAQVLTSFGEFGSALTHAQEAIRIATAIEHLEWIAATHVALGQLYLLTLAPKIAISYLESALAEAEAASSTIWARYVVPYLALAYMLERAFPRAEAILGTIIGRDAEAHNFFERQVARVWGELALRRGEPATALHIAEQLIESVPGDMQGQPIPHLLALKGEALLALKHRDEAVVALESAKVGAQQRQAPSVLWRIHKSLGRAYRLLKREVEAHHEFASARDIINRLAATIDEAPLREHFLKEALASLPSAKLLSPRAEKTKYGGLSARERQVAALVARGSTNREIAATLVTSERTAEAHVGNILTKLGFATRTQIAAWAIEKGLAKADS